MSIRSLASREGRWLMDDDPPAGMSEPPDVEARDQVQPELEDTDSREAQRSAALSELPAIGLVRKSPSRPAVSPVDDDHMSALSDGISEWAAFTPDTAEPAEDQLAAAPDLDAFYRANFDRIARRLVAVFRGDVSHAEDVTQEAFVIAYRHWPRISAMANPYGYVAKIAVRLAVKWMEARRKARRARDDRAGRAQAGDFSAVSDTLIDLASVVDRLPEQLQVVTGLSLLGHSPKEIAEILGIPPATARTRLKRASDRLIMLLEESQEGPET